MSKTSRLTCAAEAFLTFVNLPAACVRPNIARLPRGSMHGHSMKDAEVFSQDDGWTLFTNVSADKKGGLVIRVTARRGKGQFKSWGRCFASANDLKAGMARLGQQIVKDLFGIKLDLPLKP